MHYTHQAFIERGEWVSKGNRYLNILVLAKTKTWVNACFETYDTYSIQIQMFITKPTFDTSECALKYIFGWSFMKKRATMIVYKRIRWYFLVTLKYREKFNRITEPLTMKIMEMFTMWLQLQHSMINVSIHQVELVSVSENDLQIIINKILVV